MNEREDKFDFTFMHWMPDVVASVADATDVLALTEMTERCYRSVVMDTPNRDLAKIGFEMRRRGTIDDFTAPPAQRNILPNSTGLCLKSKRQLKNRIECEAPWVDGDPKASFAHFDAEYKGFISRIFKEAGIRNPEEELVDHGVGDVRRAYRELELYMNRAGYMAHKPYRIQDRRVIAALCLDSLEVLCAGQDGMLTVVAMLAQLEVENKNKPCPYEALNKMVTDPRATEVQIEGAFAEVHDTWQPLMERRHLNYTASRQSKTTYIEQQTRRALDFPAFKIAA